MNLFSESDHPWTVKLMIFLVVLIPTAALTLFTVHKSKPLAEFLEAVSERRIRRLRIRRATKRDL